VLPCFRACCFARAACVAIRVACVAMHAACVAARVACVAIPARVFRGWGPGGGARAVEDAAVEGAVAVAVVEGAATLPVVHKEVGCSAVRAG
jgi:hypothetical protein